VLGGVEGEGKFPRRRKREFAEKKGRDASNWALEKKEPQHPLLGKKID